MITRPQYPHVHVVLRIAVDITCTCANHALTAVVHLTTAMWIIYSIAMQTVSVLQYLLQV